MLVVCASSCSKRSQIAVAVEELRKTNESIRWDASTAVVADVTCDGKPDTVILGYRKQAVSVAVVSGTNKKPTTMTFPIATGTQDSFCNRPTKIEVTGLDCESDQGALPGCKPEKSCHAFTVVDTECDPFNFYWNSDKKALNWWRL